MQQDFDSVKVQEVEAMVRQYREERDVYDDLDRQTKEAKKVCDNTGKNILSILDHFKMSSHKTVYGTVIRNERWMWSTPKEADSRGAFREFLETKGEFENLWSVHSQTLNSRAKEWLEEAVEAGDIDFHVPGLAEPKMNSYLSFRRK